MWPVFRSLPWRVLGSCTPAYLWKAEQFPLVRDVKRFPDKRFPSPLKKNDKASAELLVSVGIELC